MKVLKCLVPAGTALLLLAVAINEPRCGNFIVLKEGTPVEVKLTGDFNVAAVKEGGKVPLAVAEKVMNEGYVLIEAGAPVEAVFVPGKEIDGAGHLRFSSVQAADGQDVMLRATPKVEETVEGKDAARELSVLAPEDDMRVTAGTIFRTYLADSYFIEE